MAAPATSVARGPTPARWAAFFGIAAVVMVLDQVSKSWVDGAFALASPYAPAGQAGGPTQIVGDLVRIAKTYNDGGIFGMLGASAPFLGVASLVVIGVIVVIEARQGRDDPLLTIALGLLLGGALGNLIDRSRLGAVIDWVDAGIGGVRWYTFNVADSAISIAVVLLVVIGLFGPRLGRLTSSRPAARSSPDAGTPPAGPVPADGPPLPVDGPVTGQGRP